jgi:hypothetical protein
MRGESTGAPSSKEPSSNTRLSDANRQSRDKIKTTWHQCIYVCTHTHTQTRDVMRDVSPKNAMHALYPHVTLKSTHTHTNSIVKLRLGQLHSPSPSPPLLPQIMFYAPRLHSSSVRASNQAASQIDRRPRRPQKEPGRQGQWIRKCRYARTGLSEVSLTTWLPCYSKRMATVSNTSGGGFRN